MIIPALGQPWVGGYRLVQVTNEDWASVKNLEAEFNEERPYRCAFPDQNGSGVHVVQSEVGDVVGVVVLHEQFLKVVYTSPSALHRGRSIATFATAVAIDEHFKTGGRDLEAEGVTDGGKALMRRLGFEGQFSTKLLSHLRWADARKGIERLLDEQTLRWRVAHHEAAHAVVASAADYKVGATYLTPSVTADKTMGGYTGWGNPVAPDRTPTKETLQIHGPKAVIVLLSGQVAEEHLAALDTSVQLPSSEPNWQADDDAVRGLLAAMRVAEPERVPEDHEFRACTQSTVARLWSAIAGVARDLMPRTQDDPVTKAPADGVIAGHDVRSRVLQREDIERHLAHLR